MPQSLSQVLIHITFSTRGRYPFLHGPVREDMHRYLAGICTNSGCPAHIVGGPGDHVHVLCTLGRSASIRDLVRDAKANSSRWVKDRGGMLEKFAWQRGYAAVSVGTAEFERVRDYTAGQVEHHRQRTFQEEFRALMERCGIAYDERYCWD